MREREGVQVITDKDGIKITVYSKEYIDKYGCPCEKGKECDGHLVEPQLMPPLDEQVIKTATWVEL